MGTVIQPIERGYECYTQRTFEIAFQSNTCSNANLDSRGIRYCVRMGGGYTVYMSRLSWYGLYVCVVKEPGCYGRDL